MSNLRGFPLSMTVQSATQSDCASLCQNLNFSEVSECNPIILSWWAICGVYLLQWRLIFSSDNHQHESWASLDFDTVLLVRHEANHKSTEGRPKNTFNPESAVTAGTCYMHSRNSSKSCRYLVYFTSYFPLALLNFNVLNVCNVLSVPGTLHSAYLCQWQLPAAACVWVVVRRCEAAEATPPLGWRQNRQSPPPKCSHPKEETN